MYVSFMHIETNSNGLQMLIFVEPKNVTKKNNKIRDCPYQIYEPLD